MLFSSSSSYRSIYSKSRHISQAFPSSETSSSMATSQGYRPSNENTEQTPSKQQQMQQTLAHQAQFLPLHQPHHHLNQSLFMHSQQCTPPPQLPEIAQPSAIAQHHIACMQSHGHVGGGRLHHVMPSSPAKFCDECGVPYLRETSKFCSECGTKRLGT